MKKFAILLLALLLALPLTGCQKGQTDHSINVYNWGEYIDESIFDDFEAETGIHVNYKTFASNEMLYSAIKGGGNSYDVIIPSDYMVARMGEEGLLMELDYSKIPNAENIDERYLHPAYDTEQKYSLPYMWGTTGIIYNTTMVDKAPTSWMDLFTTDLKGQVLIFDNPRDCIGLALKALGYSNASIAGKYLFYALTASVLGSMAGMVVGFVVFPSIIWYAYQLIFSLPTFTLQFYPGMAVGSVLLSAAVIGLTTWEACRASLREKTAALLLPRAPVAGKRIFLEYITPLWKHMSFSQKTTARNLFRYKKRFFMTVLGVAGCTALLLIGFGIQDSLLPIVTKQSTELTHNDMSITLSDPKALTMEQGLAEELDSNSAVQNWGAVYTKSTTIYNAEGESASVSIVAAAKDSDLTRYVTFRTRKGHKAISFDSGSAILTEKTAENLGLHTGDTFWVENAEGTRVELTLTGITENYMFTRLYLPRAQLESLLGTEDIPWNTVYGQTTCTDAAGYNALRTDLLDCNYVSGISFTEDTTELFDNLIVSLGYVVVLIIICAAALAAVVLYNLISVNLGERKKELATIKVLGFYDQEVYRYIFREIELLALIGSGVGLALGVPLHKFIVLTVEMDQLMFIRTIAPRSYLLAVALTMVFTVVVCFVMRRHVRRISMVESMKAPE